MEKLKPCPFCGGEGKVKAAKNDWAGFTVWCECEKCHAKTSSYCPNLEKEDCALENVDYCRDKAIEVWNKRTDKS